MFVPGLNRRHAVRKKIYLALEYLSTWLTLQRVGKITNSEARSGPSALVVARELNVTGAPMMLLSEIKVLLKNGYSVMAAASLGGGLVAELEKLGVVTLVSPALGEFETLVRRLSAKADLVVVNSIVCGSWVDYLPPSVPLIWYIHEGATLNEEIQAQPQVGRALSRHPLVYTVTDHARSFLPEKDKARVLWPTVPDVPGLPPSSDNSGRPLRFAVVGSFVEYKGQALVLEALAQLSPERLAEIEFYLIGLRKGPFFEKLRELCPAEWPVFFVAELADQEAKWRTFNDFDVFCVPSWHESCSLVTLEACMLGKPVIVSDQVGAKDMLPGGQSDLIFAVGDPVDLARCLKWCLDHRGRLPAMGLEARRAYEEKASWDQFERGFMAAVESALNPPNNEEQ